MGPPPFVVANGTETFWDVLRGAGSGVLILPLIAVLENIAIASAFAHGKSIDATQVTSFTDHKKAVQRRRQRATSGIKENRLTYCRDIFIYSESVRFL